MYFDELIAKHNWPKYKVNILNDGFFMQTKGSFGEITSLSKQEREFLNINYEFSNIKILKEIIDSKKTTIKVLFELHDELKIEAVLMRFKDGRNSVCVSSQVGCPVGCVFCASGQMGLKRNLTAQEIVDQVMYFAREISPHKITNVVYMGMGEPMLNYHNVVESIRILTNPKELGLSPRRITLSSSGYIKQLRMFMEENLKTKLAISLHAPNQTLREKLMPVAKIHPLKVLMWFIHDWEEYTNKRVTYEYTLIDGVNDSEDNAIELVNLLRRRLAHVNLIPLNPIKSPLGLKKSNEKRVQRFLEVLEENNIPVTLRVTMGDEIQAACGQLANKN